MTDFDPEDFDHLDDEDETTEAGETPVEAEAGTEESHIDDDNTESGETEDETPVTHSGKRVFKTGTTVIEEDASMRGKTAEEVRRLLVGLYPELHNAVARETTKDGITTVEWLPAVGKKG